MNKALYDWLDKVENKKESSYKIIKELIKKEREREKMKNKELIFHIPRENKEDFQSIMDSVDMEEVYEAERKMRELEFKRKDSMSDNGILNDMDSHIEPKKLIYSNEMLYAFIWGSNEYALWTTNLLDLKRDEDWTEVTSLLDIPVFSYQELKNYAVAIGWIDEDNHNWLIER